MTLISGLLYEINFFGLIDGLLILVVELMTVKSPRQKELRFTCLKLMSQADCFADEISTETLVRISPVYSI